MDPLTIGLGVGGAVLSGIGGYLGQSSANERQREARDALKKQAKETGKQYSELENKWSDFAGEGLDKDYQKYHGALDNYQQNAGRYKDTQQFQYDLNKGIQQVWDPYFNEKVNLAAKQVYGGAANAGKLMSSATARNVSQAVGKQYDQSYADALKAAQEQERQEYGWYADQIARERAQIDQANQILMNNINNYNAATGMGFNALGQQTQLGTQRISDVANLNIGAINANAGQRNEWGAGLGNVGANMANYTNSLLSVQNKGNFNPSTASGGSV